MHNPAPRARWTLGLGCVFVMLLHSTLHASPAVSLPIAAVESLFHIAKSENRNQVHYAVQVDPACRPIGEKPVYAYWREFERGPRVVSYLLDLEQPAYGLAAQSEVQRHEAGGGQLELRLRAFAKRPVIVDTFRNGAQCGARAYVAIRGETALLNEIYVDIGFLRVNYALVRGIRVSDGKPVEERIQPGS
ncbi:MAG: DUF4833 domain-containing protein [Polyangiales bacterium]